MTAPVLAAIEAAAALVAVAVDAGGGPRVLASQAVATGSPRRDPMTLLAELLAATGVPLAALRHLVVDIGPGSYTGLRVALAAARMLGRFVPCTVSAVTSLEVIARRTATAERIVPGTVLVPLLEARRGRCYGGLVRVSDAGVELLGAPRCLPPAAWLSGLPDGARLCGEAATLLLGSDLAVLPAHAADAATLLELGRARPPVAVTTLEPLYLMVSAAEENAAGAAEPPHA